MKYTTGEPPEHWPPSPDWPAPQTPIVPSIWPTNPPNPWPPVYNTPQGCICPPTSEQTCKNPLCPRGARNFQPYCSVTKFTYTGDGFVSESTNTLK